MVFDLESLLSVIVFGIPALSLIVFAVVFFVYRKRKKTADAEMNENDREKLKTLKTYVTVTGIMAAVFIILLIALAVLFMLFMANM